MSDDLAEFFAKARRENEARAAGGRRALPAAGVVSRDERRDNTRCPKCGREKDDSLDELCMPHLLHRMGAGPDPDAPAGAA